MLHCIRLSAAVETTFLSQFFFTLATYFFFYITRLYRSYLGVLDSRRRTYTTIPLSNCIPFAHTYCCSLKLQKVSLLGQIASGLFLNLTIAYPIDVEKYKIMSDVVLLSVAIARDLFPERLSFTLVKRTTDRNLNSRIWSFFFLFENVFIFIVIRIFRL